MSKSTKELARELGLLRKRTSTSEHHRQRTAKSRQLFTHLVVLDFESTCWQDAKYRTQEIIEFPAVLLNTSTGEIESEFQYYVQPQENPTLSEFCRHLTGITQDEVDQGIPLSLCLTKFSQWLKKLREKHKYVYNTSTEENQSRCTFVTWSDWDLGVCLQYEVRRKQLRKPPELNSWIDLRATYRKFYERKPKGLNGALQDLGMNFEGREHSGLHDARNTAKLAYRMMCDGCVMNITKTIQGPIASWTKLKSKAEDTCIVDQGKVDYPKMSKFPVIILNAEPQAATSRTDSISIKAISFKTSSKLPNNYQTSSVVTPSPPKTISGQKRSAASVIRPALTVGVTKDTCRNDEKKCISVIDTSMCVRSPQAKRIKPQSGFRIFQDPSTPGSHTLYKDICLVDVTNTSQSATRHVVASAKKQSYAEALKMPAKAVVNNQASVAFRTPANNYPQYSGQFKTPYPLPPLPPSVGNMKRTPPMCTCGRRSKRKVTQNPGPNIGRMFFCCGAPASSKNKGCKFFKWDDGLSISSPGTSPALRNRCLIGSCKSISKPGSFHTGTKSFRQPVGQPHKSDGNSNSTYGASPFFTHTLPASVSGLTAVKSAPVTVTGTLSHDAICVPAAKQSFPQPDFSTPRFSRSGSTNSASPGSEALSLQVGCWKPWSAGLKKTLGIRAGVLPKLTSIEPKP